MDPRRVRRDRCHLALAGVSSQVSRALCRSNWLVLTVAQNTFVYLDAMQSNQCTNCPDLLEKTIFSVLIRRTQRFPQTSFLGEFHPRHVCLPVLSCAGVCKPEARLACFHWKYHRPFSHEGAPTFTARHFVIWPSLNPRLRFYGTEANKNNSF